MVDIAPSAMLLLLTSATEHPYDPEGNAGMDGVQERFRGPFLPPLFDDISDEELKEKSMEMAELVTAINGLRTKQLEGGGLSDLEVQQGIGYIVAIRRLRAGKTAQSELPPVLQQKLEDIF